MSPSASETHSIRIRVYYEDTDAGGIVYYANYLKFAERGRTEWLRAIGLDHQTLLAKHNLMFAVKKATIDYQAPARLDDNLIVSSRLLEVGGAKLDMQQIICHEQTGVVLAKLLVTLVSLTPEHKILRLPEDVRALLQRTCLTSMKTQI